MEGKSPQTDVLYTTCGSRARMLALHFACKKTTEWQTSPRSVLHCDRTQGVVCIVPPAGKENK
eukprot:12884487-Prorocentrum_lima.AAC.1